MTEPDVQILADDGCTSLTPHARAVVAGLLQAAGLTSCMVTSTARTPEHQAAVMWANVLAHGMASQLGLYGAPGRAVLDAGDRAKRRGGERPAIEAAMAAEIYRQGPSRVSHHCLGPEERKKLSVLDISPASIGKPDRFEDAIRQALTAGTVSKFLSKAQGDPAYHLEIPEPPGVSLS